MFENPQKFNFCIQGKHFPEKIYFLVKSQILSIKKSGHWSEKRRGLYTHINNKTKTLGFSECIL